MADNITAENVSLDEELRITAPEDSLPPLSLDRLPENMQDAAQANDRWSRILHTKPDLFCLIAISAGCYERRLIQSIAEVSGQGRRFGR